MPVAVTDRLAVPPAKTLVDTGGVVMTGGSGVVSTLRLKAGLVAEPEAFVTTTW